MFLVLQDSQVNVDSSAQSLPLCFSLHFLLRLLPEELLCLILLPLLFVLHSVCLFLFSSPLPAWCSLSESSELAVALALQELRLPKALCQV